MSVQYSTALGCPFSCRWTAECAQSSPPVCYYKLVYVTKILYILGFTDVHKLDINILEGRKEKF